MSEFAGHIKVNTSYILSLDKIDWVSTLQIKSKKKYGWETDLGYKIATVIQSHST